MKIGGSIYLWTIVIVLFFRKFAKAWEQDQGYRKLKVPDAEVTARVDEEDLTYDQVTEAFSRTAAAPEPERPITN
jgi:putative membrane protein